MKSKIYLNNLGIINALGYNKHMILDNLLRGSREGLKRQTNTQGTFTVAAVSPKQTRKLPRVYDNRLNRLLAYACDQIRPAVDKLISRFGSQRIGVVIGSTDNGSEESLQALRIYQESGSFPEDYSFHKQEAHNSSCFVKEYLNLKSIACNISTACTSSARAFIFARSLLNSGVCDAVITGGADIVSDPILLGFHSLEAVDREPCKPFSKNRKGTNLGEGAALFIVTKDQTAQCNISLTGCGESSDAYHITAPDPEGIGASESMRRALKDAGLAAEDINYINLHGTGTMLNDRMECKATGRVFKNIPPCSSTKTMIGHTLGAAGAMELAFCWLVLSQNDDEILLPPHIWDEEPEEGLPVLNFIPVGYKTKRIYNCMSNSYAFGGCNVSLIITREEG
ncbi:MAG: beta-ketoacyl-ACP synthase [Spirochaetales bacterium]|nr:beta-ketoacyl-ACP synthase [Spirochaetales bacterium]